jgi:hypothetical protein
VRNEITIIRAYNPQAVVRVAGFDWAYDLTPRREAPINASNIGYVTHPYSNKRPQPWEPKWEMDFISRKVPSLRRNSAAHRQPRLTRPNLPTDRHHQLPESK